MDGGKEDDDDDDDDIEFKRSLYAAVAIYKQTMTLQNKLPSTDLGL